MFLRETGNSPLDLRENDTNLETYHPNTPAAQQQQQPPPRADSGEATKRGWTNRGHSRWLPRFTTSTTKTPHHRSLSEKMSRLASLDSTRSSSSMEGDGDDHHHRTHRNNHSQNDDDATNDRTMPLISITPNDATAPQGAQQSSRQATEQVTSSPSNYTNPNRIKHEQYNNYYGRSRIGLARDGNNSNSNNHDDNEHEDEDDDDEYFDDSPLPIPYSSSAMAHTKVVRQQTAVDGIQHTTTLPYAPGHRHNHVRSTDSNSFGGATYEDLLDDRQGMNNSEQQFTKGEKMSRPSLDGSIISELRLDGKGGKTSGGKGGSGRSKDKQARSKSPSSSSMSYMKRNRHSRRGFLGLASRLKLTRKHESIAKLQLSILNSGLIKLKTMDRDLQTFLPKERLTPKDFEQRVKLMRKYEVLSNIEYRFASRYETYVCRHATQESNQAKNNYKKCIPYDYNRVVLKTLPNVPDSDYINASHVDSLLKPNAYIAAQGPNENTIEDFWRMIWEQKTFVVVMLTKVFDFIRVMCNQYWPVELNKPERYGNLEVTLLYEEPLADFVIRTIRLTKLRNTNNQASANANDSNQTGGDANNKKATGTDRKAMGGGDHGDNDDDDDDNDEYDYTDDTSASEELLLNENLSSDGRNSSLPPVRSPKFVSRSGKGRRADQQHRKSTSGGWKRSGSRSDSDPNRLSESHLDPSRTTTNNSPTSPKETSRLGRQAGSSRAFDFSGLGADNQTNDNHSPELHQHHHMQARASSQPPNEFLHPLFRVSHLATSTGSIQSVPSTPLTPRTPSTAGLDRSSATRKAVKKKRRARTKNTRPLRTQFQVPDESQLIDDDDDDLENIDDSRQLAGAPTGGGGAGAGVGPGDGEAPARPQASERIIYQFHYNSWASHTCPFINSLLHFRRRVRICMDEMSKSGKTGPTVVHCNDGCGRTGTYLCIDANLELAEEDTVYDMFNYTKKMRQSRKFLIENLEQYRFVYDTIEEAMFCGKTWFPVSELHKRLKHKSQRNPITKKNEYQREYEKITRMTSKFSIGDCAGGHRVENREKNRDVSTVPPDNFRPYLTSFQSNDNTDYINAVFVDGYTRSKEYIVTEWPLHKTISDFWSLIYDHDCNSVILLANPGESSTYPSFLPTEKELRRKFGPVFSAEMVSYTHYQNIKSWIYTINKKIVSLTEVIAGVKSEAKTTQVFQITCWPQGHRVPTSTNALVELMNMVERWRQRTAYGPVCVVSLNGKSRAGVYCAANVAIEQVVQHSEVDVFQAVKTVRRHRPQLIENMTEYKYCYDLILHYVLHYVNQSPTNV